MHYTAELIPQQTVRGRQAGCILLPSMWSGRLLTLCDLASEDIEMEDLNYYHANYSR